MGARPLNSEQKVQVSPDDECRDAGRKRRHDTTKA